jgi:hypothetical protein
LLVIWDWCLNILWISIIIICNYWADAAFDDSCSLSKLMLKEDIEAAPR